MICLLMITSVCTYLVCMRRTGTVGRGRSRWTHPLPGPCHSHPEVIQSNLSKPYPDKTEHLPKPNDFRGPEFFPYYFFVKTRVTLSECMYVCVCSLNFAFYGIVCSRNILSRLVS